MEIDDFFEIEGLNKDKEKELREAIKKKLPSVISGGEL